MDPFQSLWVGGNLSLLEVMSIKSFLMNGHEYHLYTYGDVGNAPNGVKIKNAEEILPRSMAVRDQYGSYAFFSDKFRYKLLLDRGGWWVDTDMICLRHIDIEEPYCFGLEEPGRANNAVIKTPAYSLLIRSLWHYASQKEEHSPWGAIGPSLLTSLLSNESVKDLLKFVKPQGAFYPIHYSQWQLMFIERPTIDDLIPDSAYCVHLWNDMIRRGNAVTDKNFIFGHRSLIGSWQRRFIPEHC